MAIPLSSYTWYITQWKQSRARLEMNPAERALYRELIDYCFAEGSLPADESQLAQIAAFNEKDFRKSWPKVKSWFANTEGGRLVQRRVAEIRPRLAEWHDQKRTAGKLGGRRSATVRGTKKQPYAEPHGTAYAEAGGTAYAEAGAQANKLQVTSSLPPSPPAPSQNVADRFDEWIANYPNPVKITTARAAWFSLMDLGEITEDTVDEVFAGLERWRNSAQWARENGQYIPGPTAFLTGNEKHHGRLWKDHPKPLEAPKRPASSAGNDANTEWVEPADWKNGASPMSDEEREQLARMEVELKQKKANARR